MRIKIIEIKDDLIIFERIFPNKTIRFSCNKNAFPKNTLSGDDFYFIEHGIFDHYRDNVMIDGLCINWYKDIVPSIKKI